MSLLDQCIAFYLGQKLTYDKVLEVLGAVDIDVFNRLIVEIAKGQTMEALAIIEEIIWQGRELSQFVTDFTWYMRNLMMVKVSDEVNDQLDISAENLAIMKQTAQELELNTLMRYIRVFSELSNRIRYATQKRVSLELAIIKLTTPQMEVDTDSILDRLRVLERKVEKTSIALAEGQFAPVQQPDSPAKEQVAEPDLDREKVLKKELTPAEYEDMKLIIENIQKIRKTSELRDRIGQGTMKLLDAASINIGPDRKSVLLSFDNSQEGKMGFQQFSKEDHMKALQDLVAELTGKQVEISCQSKESLAEKDVTSVNLSKVHFDIITEE